MKAASQPGRGCGRAGDQLEELAQMDRVEQSEDIVERQILQKGGLCAEGGRGAGRVPADAACSQLTRNGRKPASRPRRNTMPRD